MYGFYRRRDFDLLGQIELLAAAHLCDYQGGDGTERDGERMGSVLNAKITETEQVGMTRALSIASSLADLIEYENPGILDITALAETERPVHEFEQQL